MTAQLDAEWEQILAPAIASLESTRPVGSTTNIEIRRHDA